MKYSYLLYTWLMGWLLMASCQNEDLTEDVGYLCMDIETVTLLNPQTKAPANYNPKQLAVRIKNEKGEIQAETTDHTQWNKPMALKVGTYTVEAASNGFDGQEAGFDLPYYTGSTEVVVEAGKQKTAALTCRLANVKVTVNYSEEFARYFKVATTTVTAQQKANSTLDFVMGSAQLAGYFPVDDLNVTVKVTNQAGNQFSKTQEIKGVKARDHYIIQYRIAETGNGDIAVEIDPKENKYTFTFDVSTRPKTSLSVETVDAWGTLAYAYGKVATATSGQTFDDSKFGFEYKAASAQEWQTAGVRKEGSHYKAVIKGLQPKGVSGTLRLQERSRGFQQPGNDVQHGGYTGFAQRKSGRLVPEWQNVVCLLAGFLQRERGFVVGLQQSGNDYGNGGLGQQESYTGQCGQRAYTWRKVGRTEVAVCFGIRHR